MTQSLIPLFFVLLGSFAIAQEEDPLDVQLGEKLFLDDRFSQSFFAKSLSDVNQLVSDGDPVLEFLNTPTGMIQHPHRGRQISCASCHFVDQASQFQENLVFTYNDFATRSELPLRPDNQTKTLRNSMNMVISSLEDGKPLHWDGEFYSTSELSCAALVGRNMGWLNSEQEQARQHLVKVLRKDNGSYPIGADLMGSYLENFQSLGIELSQLSDEDVLNNACEVMGVYLKSLDFSRDSMGDFNASAYDRFLEVNGLRRGKKVGETSREYLQYIRDHLNYKQDWKWVEAEPLKFHGKASGFGPKELAGMGVFFTRGQCVACHTPPEFTNYGFHRSGISQLEYDRVHGGGSFAALKIPDWESREKMAKKYLTATPDHPEWEGNFAKIPSQENPLAVDLGVWNILGHPDKDRNQAALKETLCFSERMPDCSDWSDDEFLSRSIGAFKTPTLRSLGQSAPYFHNGMAKSLHDVLTIYMATSHMARKGHLVNPDPMFKAMHMMPKDFDALEAFLHSLNEDYD